METNLPPQTDDTKPAILSVRDVAQALSLSQPTVYQMLYDKRLVGVRVSGGRHWGVPAWEVTRLLHSAKIHKSVVRVRSEQVKIGAQSAPSVDSGLTESEWKILVTLGSSNHYVRYTELFVRTGLSNSSLDRGLKRLLHKGRIEKHRWNRGYKRRGEAAINAGATGNSSNGDLNQAVRSIRNTLDDRERWQADLASLESHNRDLRASADALRQENHNLILSVCSLVNSINTLKMICWSQVPIPLQMYIATALGKAEKDIGRLLGEDKPGVTLGD